MFSQTVVSARCAEKHHPWTALFDKRLQNLVS